MCVGCYHHLLADARLKNEQVCGCYILLCTYINVDMLVQYLLLMSTLPECKPTVAIIIHR